ncbi:MAG: rhamnogalacturonan acetylesterase [Lachnospiraceae bacterium]|nr:rhamnogalacturonan acetylesterase [Lachnospiraceae bacterium]
MTKIYWAGDSTVQYNDITTYPYAGIGQAMHLFCKPNVEIVNRARNGRSTKSFMDEGRLALIDAVISEGDFFFIQFGHNDEKINDPSRYTEPYSTFQDNLRIYIDVARNKGAWPVLITPLERRFFAEDGKLTKGEHGDYVAGMKQVAAKENVPLIDLNAMSRQEMEKAGPEGTKRWFVHVPAGIYPYCPEGKADNSRLQYAGAVVFAGCIARGLKELGGVYADLLVDWGENDAQGQSKEAQFLNDSNTAVIR